MAAAVAAGPVLSMAVVPVACVGAVVAVVTVLSHRDSNQHGGHITAVGVDEGVSVVPRVIPAAATAEPVVVVRVEDLVVEADHDLYARSYDGHGVIRGEREVDVGVAGTGGMAAAVDALAAVVAAGERERWRQSRPAGPRLDRTAQYGGAYELVQERGVARGRPRVEGRGLERGTMGYRRRDAVTDSVTPCALGALAGDLGDLTGRVSSDAALKLLSVAKKNPEVLFG